MDIATITAERTGNEIASLLKKGVCMHFSYMAPKGKPVVCRDCGKTFASEDELLEESDDMRAEYL
jgi:hypothetical protein